jgi:hypothetical protein
MAQSRANGMSVRMLAQRHRLANRRIVHGGVVGGAALSAAHPSKQGANNLSGKRQQADLNGNINSDSSSRDDRSMSNNGGQNGRASRAIGIKPATSCMTSYATSNGKQLHGMAWRFHGQQPQFSPHDVAQ